MKAIILAIDALDPKIISHLIKKGKLPSFKELFNKGTFSVLPTVNPPQSPVAWASFITGQDPQKHGVLDFVTRDLKTYLPQSVYSVEAPLRFKNPFWKTLNKINISTTILFLPNTFPASNLKGKIISGMGTPDILGTMGSGLLYSSNPKPIKTELKVVKKIIRLNKTETNQTYIYGPRYQDLTGKIKQSLLPLTIKLKKKGLLLSLNNDKELFLKENEFSPYLPITFKLPFFRSIQALAVFYLKSIKPDINLYLMPLLINPEKPAFQISFPKDYSIELKNQIGFFNTLGIPYDNKAYEQDIYSKQAFLKQVNRVFEERKKILNLELTRFKQGVLVFYEGMVDIVQHMFWKDKEVVYQYYTKIDQLINNLINQYINKKTPLFILSDHGFAPFDYQVNLNNLLLEKGYLKGSGMEIDWTKTKAYALGFNSLYLNLKDRERQGIIDPSEKEKIINQLKNDLLTFPYIAKVEAVKTGSSSIKDGPEIIVGFKPPYRASWKTAIGVLGDAIVEPRNSKWTGDHLFEKSFVPGVFFSNQKLKTPQNLSIRTVLNFILQYLNG